MKARNPVAALIARFAGRLRYRSCSGSSKIRSWRTPGETPSTTTRETARSPPFQAARWSRTRFRHRQSFHRGAITNDGFIDLFVTVGDFAFRVPSITHNFLYRNNGDGTFTKITDDDVVTDRTTQAPGASWGDYDNDGFLVTPEVEPCDEHLPVQALLDFGRVGAIEK